MIMRKYLLIIFSLLSLNLSAASVIRQAKDALKKKQNLEQTAKNLLAEAVKEGTSHADRVECYVLAAECSQKLYEAQNLKLYLKQKYDTAAFYANILETFRRLELADSIESCPDEKGRVRLQNRRRSHDVLMPFRTNLLNGGKWYFLKDKMKEALPYFDTYAATASHPIFSRDSLQKTDSLVAQAAYLAVVAANAAQNSDGVIRNADLAKLAGRKNHLVQEYLARAFLAKGDSARWLASLYDGLREHTGHGYFFSHLVDYYLDTQDTKRALEIADSAISVADTVPLFWYGRSLVLLKQGRDREAIDACDSCLQYAPDHVDALYNKGIASLNLAIIYTEKACTDLTNPQCRRDQEIIQSLYNLAKLPMERVRTLEPDKPQRWAPPLYRIYLNLNMGKEFDEIDRILHSN